MPIAVVRIRSSESLQPFMLASLDLLRAVDDADDVPTEVRMAAERLKDVVEGHRGAL